MFGKSLMSNRLAKKIAYLEAYLEENPSMPTCMRERLTAKLEKLKARAK